MRGCFVKDLYTLLKYLPFYALYCLAFVLIAVFTKNTAFVTGLAVLLPVSVISAVVTADKKDGFTEYAFACGLSPLAVAAEKLILALGFAAFAVALWPLAYFLAFPSGTELYGLSVTAAVALASVAVSLPLSYKLGAERGRLVLGIVMLALIAACVALMTAFGDAMPGASPLLLISLPVVTAAACVGSLAATAKAVRE